MQLTLILIALGCYATGCVTGLLFVSRRGRWVGVTYRLLVLLGLAAHTTLGLLRWHETGTFPVNQLAESVWLLVWFLALALVVTDYVYGLPTLGPFVLPVVVLLAAVGLFLGRPESFEPASWTPVHVVGVVLGFAGFAVATTSSVLYLVGERALKTKTSNALSGKLPSLETLDRVNFHALGFGFVLVTIGLGVGVAAAMETGQLGSSWWQDSKVVVSLAVWVFYAAVVACRLVRSLRGRRIAWLTVVGFVLVLLALVGTDLLLPGTHAKLGNPSSRAPEPVWSRLTV